MPIIVEVVVRDPLRSARPAGLGHWGPVLFATWIAILVVLVTTSAQAQGRRGSLTVLGLRAPNGDDDIAATVTAALRRAATAAGFSVRDESPALEQSMAAFGCDESLPVDCLGQIANDLHAERMVYGSVRRAGRGRQAPIRIEVSVYDHSARTTNGPQQVEVPRAIAQDGDAVGPHVRRLIDQLLPPPPPPAPAPVSETRTETPSPSSPPPPIRRYIGYGAIGVGGAAVVAGLVFGTLWFTRWLDTSRDDSRFHSYQPFNLDTQQGRQDATDTQKVCAALERQTPSMHGGPTDPNELRSLHAQYCVEPITFSALGWALGSAGAALAATGLVLILTDSARPSTTTEERQATLRFPQWTVVPELAPSYQGATFQLRF